MTVKISISISDQQAEYARRQVAEGRFSSTSAVIQQALEAKRREDEDYEEWKAGFFAEMQRRAEGPHIPFEEFQERIEEMIARKERQYGVER
jgi:antitoxin ParD1/3/4